MFRRCTYSLRETSYFMTVVPGGSWSKITGHMDRHTRRHHAHRHDTITMCAANADIWKCIRKRNKSTHKWDYKRFNFFAFCKPKIISLKHLTVTVLGQVFRIASLIFGGFWWRKRWKRCGGGGGRVIYYQYTSIKTFLKSCYS